MCLGAKTRIGYIFQDKKENILGMIFIFECGQKIQFS